MSKERSALFRLLVQEGTRVPATAQAYNTRVAEQFFKFHTAMFSSVMDRGECRKLEHDVAQLMIFSCLNTVLLQIALQGQEAVNPETTMKVFKHYFQMLKDYMLLRPGEGGQPRAVS